MSSPTRYVPSPSMTVLGPGGGAGSGGGASVCGGEAVTVTVFVTVVVFDSPPSIMFPITLSMTSPPTTPPAINQPRPFGFGFAETAGFGFAGTALCHAVPSQYFRLGPPAGSGYQPAGGKGGGDAVIARSA